MVSPSGSRVGVKDSETFEQQIHRVHELLDGSGADVTWDDHIPDPDNPSQLRQIDITIKRDGKVTFVECRNYKRPQDVQWIEELMGRRSSLAADAIIAVSSSGFTKGAIEKARQHDILLRDLRRLTDLEIRSWSRRIALKVYFYQYTDLKVSLYFPRDSILKLDLADAGLQLRSYPGMQSLFNAAARHLGTLNLMSSQPAGKKVEFGLRAELKDFRLSGEPVLYVDFRGQACLISREVVSKAILAYGHPQDRSVHREATVETFSLGETAISYDEDRISLYLDISDLEMPPFCQFRFFSADGDDEVDYEAVEILGVDKLWVRGRMKVDIRAA